MDRRGFLRVATAGAGVVALGSTGCTPPPTALDPLAGHVGAPTAVRGRDSWARMPAAINRRVTTGTAPAAMRVLSGAVPDDLAGHVFWQSLALRDDDSGFSGDSLIWRLDLDGDEPLLRSRILHTADYELGRAFADTPYAFESRGMVRLGPLGLQNQTNTALVALGGNRLIATVDGGRPWELDPATLRPVGPVGQLEDYRPMAESRHLNRFLCPMTITSAHPPYDAETGEYYGVSLSIVPVPGMIYCEVLCWDGSGAMRRVPLRTPDGRPLLISQSAHQLCLSRDHLVILDAASTIEGEKLLNPPHSRAAGRFTAPRPDSYVYLVDRQQLRVATGRVTARRAVIPRESGHLMVDYDNAPGRIVVHSPHTTALDVAEWVMPWDRHPTGGPVRPELVDAITPVGYDIGVVGRYEIDTRTGAVVDQHLFYDDRTWGTGGLTARNPNTPVSTLGDQYHANSGFPTDLALDRVARGFRHHPHRIVPFDELPWEGVPSSLVRIDHDAGRIVDAFFAPGDRFLWTPTFVPRRGTASGSADGHVVAVVYGDDVTRDSAGTELWVFDAAALHLGPVTRLGLPDLEMPLTLHSIWLDSLHADLPDERVDVASELLARARTWRFDPQVESIVRNDAVPAYLDHVV